MKYYTFISLDRKIEIGVIEENKEKATRKARLITNVRRLRLLNTKKIKCS